MVPRMFLVCLIIKFLLKGMALQTLQGQPAHVQALRRQTGIRVMTACLDSSHVLLVTFVLLTY